jgi:hypothetical protein
MSARINWQISRLANLKMAGKADCGEDSGRTENVELKADG